MKRKKKRGAPRSKRGKRITKTVRTMMKTTTTLGAPTKVHASAAKSAVSSAEMSLKDAHSPKSCKVRYDAVHSAVNQIAKAWTHAFGSGGRVHKGALTPRNVSTDIALRIYKADEDMTRASEAFRRDCVKT